MPLKLNLLAITRFRYTEVFFHTVNPLLSAPPPPRGAYLFQAHLRGRGLIETGGLIYLIYKLRWYWFSIPDLSTRSFTVVID